MSFRLQSRVQETLDGARVRVRILGRKHEVCPILRMQVSACMRAGQGRKCDLESELSARLRMHVQSACKGLLLRTAHDGYGQGLAYTPRAVARSTRIAGVGPRASVV